MEMITGIERRLDVCGMIWVPRRGIEINHAINLDVNDNAVLRRHLMTCVMTLAPNGGIRVVSSSSLGIRGLCGKNLRIPFRQLPPVGRSQDCQAPIAKAMRRRLPNTRMQAGARGLGSTRPSYSLSHNLSPQPDQNGKKVAQHDE